MVIKEWFCAEHGAFEGSHPICPHMGCDSAEVIQEHRTPPAISTGLAKRTDAGFRRTEEMYGMKLKSGAQQGESSKANNRSNEMIWGLEKAQKQLGAPLLHNPVSYSIKEDNGQVRKWEDRGGMQTMASEIGMPKHVVPKAGEVIGSLGERKS